MNVLFGRARKSRLFKTIDYGSLEHPAARAGCTRVFYSSVPMPGPTPRAAERGARHKRRHRVRSHRRRRWQRWRSRPGGAGWPGWPGWHGRRRRRQPQLRWWRAGRLAVGCGGRDAVTHGHAGLEHAAVRAPTDTKPNVSSGRVGLLKKLDLVGFAHVRTFPFRARGTCGQAKPIATVTAKKKKQSRSCGKDSAAAF